LGFLLFIQLSQFSISAPHKKALSQQIIFKKVVFVLHLFFNPNYALELRYEVLNSNESESFIGFSIAHRYG